MISMSCQTRCHLAKNKRMMKYILSILFFLGVTAATFAQDVIARPSVDKLVVDEAHVLSMEQIMMLTDSLNRFAQETSTQVLVVTVSDLNGYPIAEYAQKLGQAWGVGIKGKNNGVVILVKPKMNAQDRGYAFIAAGYGLEGALPDVMCSRIVRDVMIPHFRNDDYGSGIVAGAMTVMKAVRGEYTSDETEFDDDDEVAILAIFLIFIGIAIIIAAVNNDNKRNGSNGSLGRHISDAAILSSMLNSSRHSDSGWGSFSGGGGSFGGFGGFGGGSFGGGGGGGSW